MRDCISMDWQKPMKFITTCFRLLALSRNGEEIMYYVNSRQLDHFYFHELNLLIFLEKFVPHSEREQIFLSLMVYNMRTYQSLI